MKDAKARIDAFLAHVKPRGGEKAATTLLTNPKKNMRLVYVPARKAWVFLSQGEPVEVEGRKFWPKVSKLAETIRGYGFLVEPIPGSTTEMQVRVHIPDLRELLKQEM
jgi:hypothetical protein